MRFRQRKREREKQRKRKCERTIDEKESIIIEREHAFWWWERNFILSIEI